MLPSRGNVSPLSSHPARLRPAIQGAADSRPAARTGAHQVNTAPGFGPSPGQTSHDDTRLQGSHVSIDELAALLAQAHQTHHPPAPDLTRPTRQMPAGRSNPKVRAASDLSQTQRRELAAALQNSLLKDGAPAEPGVPSNGAGGRGRRVKMAGLAALLASSALGTGLVFSTTIVNLPPPRPPAAINQAAAPAPKPPIQGPQKTVAESEAPLQASAAGVLAQSELAFSGPFNPQFRVRNGEGRFGNEQPLTRSNVPSVSTLTAEDRTEADQRSAERTAPAQGTVSTGNGTPLTTTASARPDYETQIRPASPVRPVSPAGSETRRAAARPAAAPARQHQPTAQTPVANEPVVLQPPPARLAAAAATRTSLQQPSRSGAAPLEQLFGKVEGAREDPRSEAQR